MLTRHEHRIELALVLGVFVLASVVSQVRQQPISLNNGQGWDGVTYFHVADQFAHHQRPDGEAPFVYRIGTPLLASVVSKSNLLAGFKVVNIAGSLVATLLFVWWLRFHLTSWKIRVLMTVCFIAMWHAPVRFVYFYPAYADPWLFVALIAGLIGIQHAKSHPTVARTGLLGSIVFAGVIFRESALIIAAAFLFSPNPLIQPADASAALAHLQVDRLVKRIPLILFVPLALGLLGLLIVSRAASQTNSYSFLKTAVEMAYAKPGLTYLHAWFIAFGPIVIIVMYHWRDAIRILANNQSLLIYLIGFSVLGWIGGSDTERILFWSAPVVYMLIGKVLEDHPASMGSRPLQIVLCVSHLISARVFWTIPDYPSVAKSPLPILTIPSSQGQYYDLYSYFASPRIQVISLVEYLALGVVLLWWLNYRAVITRGAHPHRS